MQNDFSEVETLPALESTRRFGCRRPWMDTADSGCAIHVPTAMGFLAAESMCRSLGGRLPTEPLDRLQSMIAQPMSYWLSIGAMDTVVRHGNDSACSIATSFGGQVEQSCMVVAPVVCIAEADQVTTMDSLDRRPHAVNVSASNVAPFRGSDMRALADSLLVIQPDQQIHKRASGSIYFEGTYAAAIGPVAANAVDAIRTCDSGVYMAGQLAVDELHRVETDAPSRVWVALHPSILDQGVSVRANRSTACIALEG